MNIVKNITINLSEDDVKEIVVDYLKQNGYKAGIEDIKVEIGSRCVGYFTDEHDESYFKGISVKCKERNGL